ncbi:bifunctional YncE family protein/alkaline phosphatase family protein [Paenibacillus filicis]|uniref:Bifunctional YncE family protein/alkaline phosphatase family protein n=1 Tax=Paenibacillus gyeongsangnamensis TaxID=3388067 RepID=A0ABT4QAE8_9BACL|nr:bifunctional YncE family protein/alkaline phosphatase family protein [Paenibacillus filicis]MCZ8513867.1 bifunctional YncE family protein/alkaline phosphatase family protein [Paenibacillus filicis]
MKKISKKMFAIVLAATVVGSGTAMASYNTVAGPQSDTTGVTPHGWFLSPAGKQLTLGSFPMGGAISRDHKYLVVSNDGAGTQSLQVVDIAQQKVIQTIPYQTPESLFLGVTFSPDGKKLYASASGNDKIRVFNFDNGILTEQSPIIMKNQKNTKIYPAGISISPDGKFLYTANNLDNSVSLIDLSTGTITATIPVGKDPYMALLSRDGSTLYVSNWGESSITVLNAKDLTVQKTITVGLHPNALAENPVNGNIYVANSDSDEISIVDPKQQQVIQTVSLAPYRNAPTGSIPNALTVSPDGKTLYIANAGNDDIAVVDLGNDTASVKGLIPTAWYPTGVYLTNDGKQLMVLNAKGLGAGPNPQHTINSFTADNWASHQYIGNMIQGTMSFIDVPSDKQLSEYTKQVNNNNQVTQASKDGGFSRVKGEKDSPIPRFADQKSPIKHVIYIFKENHTYDQIFGDLGKGNGDPNITQFGKKITPNLHKLANQFVTLDNFYADGEVSQDGHPWMTQAEANDYTQKSWPANYSYPTSRKAGGDADATKVSKGFIWNNAFRSGVTFRDYGEAVNYNAKTGISTPNDPSMGNNIDAQYPGWGSPLSSISDVQRVDEWAKEFHQFEQNDNLPQLEMVLLPNDHTEGTKPGALTPSAFVAQNDYALGKLVDIVSHSKYWKDTAIFVAEDDAQDGPDHVDAHREEALVISPYTQTGKVDSTFYDQMSMYRSIENILGMKPMTQFDASAIPMLNAFTNHPNFAPYTAEQPTYPLNEVNGKNAPMAEVSKQMDFSKPDAADHKLLNLAIWKATKGDQPYPESKK